MQWVDKDCVYNVRSLYQFDEDLCLQQLDSEVHLMGQRLSGLYGVTWSGRMGSYWTASGW